MKKLYGITTAMLTPIDENGEIKIDALKKYVNFLLSKGVNCLYPLGSMGEMHLLNIAQRKKVAEIIVNEVNGRVPVFVHVGAIRQEDAIELAQHAHDVGADGIGAVTPSYWPFKKNEIENFYFTLSQSVPENFPIYMYNIPQYSTIDLTVDVVKKIAEHCSNIVGIKYSVGDMSRTRQYLSVRNGDFSVLQGGDLLTTLAMILGCDGVISGYSSAFPELIVGIYNAYKEGDFKKATEIQNQAASLSAFLKSEISTIPKLKSILKIRGMDIGIAKAPFLNPSDEQYKLLKKELEKYNLD